MVSTLKSRLLTFHNFAVYVFYLEHRLPECCSKALFFAHANGIPALTYQVPFFQPWLEQNSDYFIVSYDMRGMGGSAGLSVELALRQSGWPVLVQDHLHVWEYAASLFSHILQWTFAGHSLGSWLSLLAMPFVQEQRVSRRLHLYDMPLLPTPKAFAWMALCVLHRRDLSPLSQKVRKRRLHYPSLEIALTSYCRSQMTRQWHPQAIQDYVSSLFSVNQQGVLTLRHDPAWEADLFQQYPICAAAQFLKIPLKIRQRLIPLFFVGQKSETCNPKASRWVQLFFPQAIWHLVPGGHMFLLETIPSRAFSTLYDG